jgi:FHS family glucose/mannose:H+ symporter-like MFS transporter
MPITAEPRSTSEPLDHLSIYMHGIYFLTGLGVMMLGPILPFLSLQWKLTDSSSGALLAAQFIGSFCGAVLVQSNLRRGLAFGGICLVAGYALLATATRLPSGFPVGVVSLLLAGFGLGHLINSVSLLAGRRYTHNRGSALMSLNLIWSAGALVSPLLVGLVLLHVSLAVLIGGYAALGITLLVLQTLLKPQDWRGVIVEETTPANADSEGHTGSSWKLPIYFALLFFLYGAMENGVSGWLTSFAVRYTHTITYGALSTSLLWAGITAGRAGGLLCLRVLTEKQLQMGALALTILSSALLAVVHHPWQLLLLAVTIGCGLAPFIPITTSLFFAKASPSTRQAGLVLSISALGGAAAQWSIGALSQVTGSLKLALELPTTVGVLLCILCLSSRQTDTSTSPPPSRERDS